MRSTGSILPQRQRALPLLLLSALAAVLAVPSVARAEAYVPPALLERAAASRTQTFHVIVVGESGVTTGELARAMRAPEGRQFGSVRQEFEVINGFAADMTGGQILGLSKRGDVRSITVDGRVQRNATAPLWPLAVGLDRLTPSSAVGTSSGPAIAIVDSGVAESPLDFGDRVTDRVNVSSFDQRGEDDQGHGTLVAGIAAGSSAMYPGAAPAQRIVSVRVTGPNGESRVSDVIAGADWIYRNRLAKGIGVVNLSLRSTQRSHGAYDPINLAVERLWLTGTVVVASAGNDGPERMLFAPASSPFVITVGATDIHGTADVADDTNAPWSSYGYTAEGFAKPELAAPGRHMVGPVPSGSVLAGTFLARVVAPGYMWMSGTSFAAPVVAGAAARLRAMHPEWSPDQVKGALMLTASPLPGAAPMSVGAGEIDVAAAAGLATPPNPNENLYAFVSKDAAGIPYLDAKRWNGHVATGASWSSASWSSASWSSASWSSASWSSASWSSASWSSASWSSASWSSASWSSASWSSASWSSASWSSAADVE